MLIANRHLKSSLGFTYIGLMLIVAIAGIALSGVGIVWKTEMQRENEKELRFAGQQYVTAIASYYECKICGPHQLPKNLKDLLKDSRAPSVVHHIRKLYRDPMTRGNDWGLIKNGDRIMGVYSKSKEEPLAKPYNLDSLNKKKNSNQSNANLLNNNQINATQNSTNQTNVTSANSEQPNLGSANANSSNNVTGANLAQLNQSDTNKTSQPIKPKKPSYQDWQFVYGGAAADTAVATNPTNSTSSTKLNNNLNDANTVLSPEAQKQKLELEQQAEDRVTEVCLPAYQEEQLRCTEKTAENQQSDSKDPKFFANCRSEATANFKACSAAVK